MSGALTDANLFGWGWRTVFLINIPITLGSLLAATRVVPETRDRGPHARTSPAGRQRSVLRR